MRDKPSLQDLLEVQYYPKAVPPLWFRFGILSANPHPEPITAAGRDGCCRQGRLTSIDLPASTKCMVVIDGQGIPIGAQLASAQISEFRLAESTLARVRVPRCGRGRPRKRLRRVIADRGYDSDGLRQQLLEHGTELIAPYIRTKKHRRFEDKRKLRRYRRRWKIERTNAWLQNFRRIQVRYDRILSVYQGFFHCACLIITLRHLCN